jgi:integrase
MKRLTDVTVRELKADPDKRREVPDPGIPGLYVVIQPGGAKSWALRYRHDGKTRKLTLGKYPKLTLSDARKAALEKHELIDAGIDPAPKRETAPPADPERDKLKTILAAYLRRKARKLRSIDHVRRYFDTEVLPKLGERDIQSITRRDISALLGAIVDRGSPITANRTFANTRAFFRWAKGEGYVSESPLEGMQAPAEENSRDRILTPDEIALFWRATAQLGQPFGPLYRLLLLTGQRLREVAQMTDRELGRKEIEVDAIQDGEPVKIRLMIDVWTIPASRAKNDTAHNVPLSKLALETLASVKRIKGAAGYVFTTSGEAPVSGFTKAKARLDKAMAKLASDDAGEPVEIPPFVIHDLRRTAASGMAELRVPPHVCEAVLNHRSGTVSGTAAVYNKYDYATEKREALTAWARRVDAIVMG